MQRTDFDVIVAGVGAMGSAACWHLARRGVRVLGLDRFAIPNAVGSSHGDTRAIRLAYHEHPDYVPLLRRAYVLWAELEAASGQALLHRTGGLYMGPAGSEIVEGALAAARLHGLEHEALGRADVAERCPPFRLPAGYRAVSEPATGVLRPELAVAAQAEQALRHGAELHAHEAVVDWQAHASGITVNTARQAYRAERLVLCGGAWSGGLVAGLGVRLVVTRQAMAWFWPSRPDVFQPGRFPTWALQHDDGTVYYGFPMLGSQPGLKLAHHQPGPQTEPDALDREPNADDEAQLRTFLRRYLPEGEGPLLALRICMYTHSPDSHFIVDRHPEHSHVLVACGFSGHGFKFAPVIGEALADLAQHGETPLPIAFLGLGRYGRRTV